MRTIISLAAIAMMAIPAYPQEKQEPGPEHELLKKKVGIWNTSMKFGDKETKGTVTFKMELGGMWLVGDMESELFGQKFQGKSLDSFDAAKKKYVGLWFDSMSSSPVMMEGTYDKEKKEMTMVGTGPGMDGTATKYRSVTRMSDNDTAVMTMWIGGGAEPAFTVTYTRRK